MDSNASSGRRVFTPEFKLKIVLESMQRDTTIEQVRRKYNVSWSAINRWRKEFRANAVEIFSDKRNPRKKPRLKHNAYRPMVA